MYCSVDSDLRRYMAAEEAAEEAAEAAAAAAEEDFITTVATCNPAARLDSPMYPKVEDLFFDMVAMGGYQYDKVMRAMMRTLMEASRRGDGSAIEAMDVVQAYYMERV